MKKPATRRTRQRDLVLKVLRSTRTHPTAYWVYEQVRKEIPDVSLGTIYRNLRVLKDMGEISELEFGPTFSRFDGNPRNHYHFTCTACGRVFDVDLPVLTELERMAQKSGDFEVHSHRLEFSGLCARCRHSRAGDG